MKKRERPGRSGEPERAAIGLEAEFACVIEGEPVDPKQTFGDPRVFIGEDALHRTGTSYHLSTGGAVYFDTGVIELVTPIVELDRGAPSQVVRSLWEGIADVREGLDRWEQQNARPVHLVGFSAHYNVSLPGMGDGARVAALAWLLVHMLPFPVMLLAANRQSTGVGVRPRPGRVEVTVDFTPDPALMAAAMAVIAAAVLETASWSSLALAELDRHGFPRLRHLRPLPHTSRQGWLVKAASLDADPFQTPPDVVRWRLSSGEKLSLRDIARRCVEPLMPRIRRLAAPGAVDLLERVLEARHPSLLDLDARPPAYENVGRLALWQERDPKRPLARSLYEMTMQAAARRQPLLCDGHRWRPLGTRGWTRILYESDDGRRRVFTVDELVRLRSTP